MGVVRTVAMFLLELATMRNTGALLNVSATLLGQGYNVRFSAPGTSMGPTIRDGETITVAPTVPSEIRRGDIVAYRRGYHVVAHRVVRVERHNESPMFLMRGDAATSSDPPVTREQILGKVVSVERRGRQRKVSSYPAKLAYTARVAASRAKRSIAAAAVMIGVRTFEALNGVEHA